MVDPTLESSGLRGTEIRLVRLRVDRQQEKWRVLVMIVVDHPSARAFTPIRTSDTNLAQPTRSFDQLTDDRVTSELLQHILEPLTPKQATGLFFEVTDWDQRTHSYDPMNP